MAQISVKIPTVNEAISQIKQLVINFSKNLPQKDSTDLVKYIFSREIALVLFSEKYQEIKDWLKFKLNSNPSPFEGLSISVLNEDYSSKMLFVQYSPKLNIEISTYKFNLNSLNSCVILFPNTFTVFKREEIYRIILDKITSPIPYYTSKRFPVIRLYRTPGSDRGMIIKYYSLEKIKEVLKEWNIILQKRREFCGIPISVSLARETCYDKIKVNGETIYIQPLDKAINEVIYRTNKNEKEILSKILKTI